MAKPVVYYSEVWNCRVGLAATLVSSSGFVLTEDVLQYDENTGRIETSDKTYLPEEN